ncbi:DUF4012 domain-containing protein [Rhodococcus sp. USK10]|uniref:DUF4012 domain-containing protein n=1 Tax=Rhodococcus sp. USK10 TaxID=2789739 RepID=UPI001C5EF921|nr:DUF4012 domain-containing protein [Rhodococcus sp. USK10]
MNYQSRGDADGANPKPENPGTSAGEPTVRRVRRRTSVRSKAYKRKRRVAAASGVAALVIVAFGLWLGYSAKEARSNLYEARNHAQLAKDALLDGNTEVAQRSAADADKYASRAYDNTHSIPWSITAAVPVLGSPLATSQQISEVVRGLTRDVLSPAVDAGSTLAPDQLIEGGGRVNVQSLRDAVPVLDRTSVAAQSLSDQAQTIDEATYLGVVNEARTALQDQTAELSKLLSNTAIAAKVVPAMLGGDGPRNYFLGFQTNAEARGTGGLLGGFGIVRATDGSAKVDTLASNSELSMDKQPIDLGPDFAARYGESRPTTDFRNSNLSSHFPYAAQIWKSLWAQESGEQVDGAVATDPVALSYVLGAIGPVTMPDGEVITKDNVVELTESTAYVRFADDNKARKQYLQTVAARVVDKMTGKLSSPQALLDALGKAAGEGRIAVWSADPALQQVLSGTKVGNVVPDDAAPYAGVVVNNQGGNKLDYYLSREIEYVADSCVDGTRSSTVTVRLTNNTPAGEFPDYVAGLFESVGNVPKGTNAVDLSLLATQGATLDKVTINGAQQFVFTGTERGHPVFNVRPLLQRGKTAEVKFELTEPTAPGEARVPVQPLVDSPNVTVDVPNCGS